jgi:HEPN domain-containing protein
MDKNIELAKEWFNKGEHDLISAGTLLEHNKELSDTICFHSQQAAEKYIKAMLVFYKIEFIKSHDITYLLGLLKDKIFVENDYFDMSDKMSDYSVEIRYPDDWYNPTLEEAKESVEIAKKFKKLLLENVSF